MNSFDIKNITDKYILEGGVFLTDAKTFGLKLQKIKAFIFDWDGVFNAGTKDERGSSNYTEIDSMGINMLRFSHWLQTGSVPVTSILSGEKSASSFHLASREHFSSCYYKIAHKTEALDHFCNTHSLKPEEIAFIFDDILDLAVAKSCGLRILINRPGVSMVKSYVTEHQLADYITSGISGAYPLRETCEMIIGVRGHWTAVIDERIHFTKKYQDYLKSRNEVETAFYSRINNQIEEENP